MPYSLTHAYYRRLMWWLNHWAAKVVTSYSNERNREQ